MATHTIPIVGAFTLPDTSGSVYPEPAAVNFQANDRYPHVPYVFADTSTRLVLGGAFRVPDNYVGTAKILVEWACATAGNGTTDKVVWEFNYTAIAIGESLDPSADQEAVTSTGTLVSTSARFRKEESISLTSANLAVGDIVQFGLARDGSDTTNDTYAGSAIMTGLFLQYADA